MSRLAALLVPTLLLVLSGACASTGSGTVRSSSSVITEEELAPMVAFTVYEAVRRLRPRWLQSRAPGQQAVVFLNDTRIGGVEELRLIEAREVVRIRYRSGPDATTRYGTGYGGGTIEIVSRGRRQGPFTLEGSPLP